MKKFKKILCFLFIIAIFSPCIYAKKPDPLYLNSDVVNMETEAAKKEAEKQKKLDKKRPKKLKQWQIDKAQMPVTTEDYMEIAQEKLRSDFEIPTPQFSGNTDFIFPDPQFRVVNYNTPPGQRNIDLTKLVRRRAASSPAILSPDKTKLVYTKSFYYPQNTQTSSAAYSVTVKNGLKEAYDILFNANVVQGSTEPIFTVGMDSVTNFKFTTLFPLDFSKDSNKIAFKEKIGSNLAQTWVTNIVVYDFKTKSLKRLTAVREAIIYYWRQNKRIELKDYMWDIYPVGWDRNNPDRIIVYAYAYTKDIPLFLGTWSIDADENRSELVSLDSTEADIDLNGLGLIEVLNGKR